MDAIFTFVVATSAGSDRADIPTPFVNWIEGGREDMAVLRKDEDDRERWEAAELAADMLSRATSVTAAALD